MNDEQGQGSVEYAIVAAGFAALVVALGYLWRSLESGLFIQHVIASASHQVQASASWLLDVFGY